MSNNSSSYLLTLVLWNLVPYFHSRHPWSLIKIYIYIMIIIMIIYSCPALRSGCEFCFPLHSDTLYMEISLQSASFSAHNRFYGIIKTPANSQWRREESLTVLLCGDSTALVSVCKSPYPGFNSNGHRIGSAKLHTTYKLWKWRPILVHIRRQTQYRLNPLK